MLSCLQETIMHLRFLRAALLAAPTLGAGAVHAAETPACDSVVCTRAQAPLAAEPRATLAPSTLARDLLRQSAALDDAHAPTRAERDWDAHMARTRNSQLAAINSSSMRPEDHEDYNCLLSVGFGGELKVGGYRAVRALGSTHTLSRKEAAGK
jgi:hypothetical protein